MKKVAVPSTLTKFSDVEHRRALVLCAGVLAVCALVSGLRLEDDSYQHFARSVLQVGALDVRALITDVWNKPVPALLYGAPGLWSLEAARLVSVALTVGTAWLSALLCLQLLPRPAPTWSLVMMFVTQLAVLKDAFVTMTELPAAFFLALALCLHSVARRPLAAALTIGVIPLCRAEMLPVAAFVGLNWTVQGVTIDGIDVRTWLRRLWPGFLALLPYALWVIAGIAVTRDPLWFQHASYAHMRRWDFPGLLRYNVLVGLVGVLSPAMLLCLFVGWWRGPALVADRMHRRLLFTCAGILVIHYLLLNTLEVFPEGWEGVSVGHAVAAINARNYTPTAPVTALFVSLGVAAWAQALGRSDAAFKRVLLGSSVAAAALIAVAHFGATDMLALELTLLAASFAGVHWTLRRRAENPAVAWRVAALAALAAALLVRPFFWYPTRWNDRRAEAVSALVQLVREQHPQLVVQDLASSLEMFGGLRDIDATWTWALDFPKRVAAAGAGSVVVLEVDDHGAPLPRYPRALQETLDSRCELVTQFHADPPAPWMGAIDRLAARNAPVHWVAYRIR